jgi:hypothetical protein
VGGFATEADVLDAAEALELDETSVKVALAAMVAEAWSPRLRNSRRLIGGVEATT